MNAKRGRRLDRRAAERVARGDWAAGGPGLQALLSAASGPARPDELTREDATVAAFRTAQAGAAVAVAFVETTPPRRRVVIKTTLAKLLTTKIAVAVAATAAVTVGGVATVAATTGGGTGTGAGAATSASTAAGPSHSEARESSELPSGAHAGDQTGDRPATQPAPSPNLTGLCHAYTAGAGADHGKALDNPAFTVLITTAGGRDKVDGYCATLLDDHSASGTPMPSTTPTSTGRDHSDDTHPGSDPTAHATTPAHPSH